MASSCCSVEEEEKEEDGGGCDVVGEEESLLQLRSSPLPDRHLFRKSSVSELFQEVEAGSQRDNTSIRWVYRARGSSKC